MFDAFGRNHLQDPAGHFEDRNIPGLMIPGLRCPANGNFKMANSDAKSKRKNYGRKAAPEVLVRYSQRWNQKTGIWL